MDRIKLTPNSQRILKLLRKNQYNEVSEADHEDINFLKQEDLVTTLEAETGSIVLIDLTDKGRAYLHINPKLKNPSIWEDKKYWITTIISLVAIIISIIALVK